MATKPAWRKCHICLEHFEAPDEKAVDELLDMHRVYKANGKECMAVPQLELTFKQQGKAWVRK